MSVQSDFGLRVRPNCFRLATVKNVSYSEETSPYKETIYIETMDGDTFEWCMSTYESIYMEEFLEARKNILSNEIAPGTEITLKCNSKGILAFSL